MIIIPKKVFTRPRAAFIPQRSLHDPKNMLGMCLAEALNRRKRKGIVLVDAKSRTAGRGVLILLMDKILHDLKDSKIWELWYIPYNG